MFLNAMRGFVCMLGLGRGLRFVVGAIVLLSALGWFSATGSGCGLVVLPILVSRLLDVGLRVLPTCFCGLLSFWLVLVCRLLVGNWLVGLGCLGYVVGLLCIGGLRSLYGSVVG